MTVSLIKKKKKHFNYTLFCSQEATTGACSFNKSLLPALSVFICGYFHMGVCFVSLPVALLQRGTQLPSRSDFVGVREILSLRPLVDLVESLLPFHGRHQLLNQLSAHVALVHVAFAIHVGVDADLGTSHLDGKVTGCKSHMDLVLSGLKNEVNTTSDVQ